MRLRNVKYAKELIEAYPDIVIVNPKKHAGKWNQLFDNSNPIELEIGCGKGKFIYEKAEKNPNINFIGIEKFDSVIVRALEKMIVNPLDNLKLIRFDAVNVDDIFITDEIDNIYLNFSDPWPKRRQAKRRLTSPQFLKRYIKILKTSGNIVFKTDNFGLFEYSLMSFNHHPLFKIENFLLNLYGDLPDNNIQTEFEIRFIEMKKPIYYIKTKRR